MKYALFLPLFFSACATFPALEGTISDAAQAAPYPILTPLPTFSATDNDDEAALLARIAALQARAARLRQIDIAALQ